MRSLKIKKSWFQLIVLLLVLVFAAIAIFSLLGSNKVGEYNGPPQLLDAITASHEHSDHAQVDVKANEEIQLAFVCGGLESPRQLYVLLKSILFYRTNRLQLHILVDNISLMILEELFSTWRVQDLRISYYNMIEYEKHIAWIPSPHYSKRYGLMKLVFPSILSKLGHLERVIMMDTDLLLLGDIITIWNLFDTKKKGTSFAMVENQSYWYRKDSKLSGEHSVWPALGKGFNSGLVLVDLLAIRNVGWDQLWREVADIELVSSLYATLADQDIYNTIFRDHPDMVHKLPCNFNLQLNDHTNLTEACPNQYQFRVIHWNSPHKLLSNNPNAQCYLSWYNTFKNWSAKLLEKGPCCLPDELGQEYKESEKVDDPCNGFRPRSTDRLRTLLYFTKFELKPQVNDVTLVVHLSLDRLPVFDQLITHWTGPVSAAIYLYESETDALDEFIEDNNSLRDRKNIGYHLVFRDEGFNYPINRLRNIAIKQAQTPFIFISDVDFLPPYNLYRYLIQNIADLRNSGRPNPLEKRALVIPAFENSQYKFEYPSNKLDLLAQLDIGSITTFRGEIWPKGHAATDYDKWRLASTAYKVEWDPDYEPFVVTGKNVPHFDERFVGFGWNKVEHATLLAAKGYEFIVLPDAFLIHKFHPASYDIMKHRESAKYRACINKLKRSFLLELKSNYPDFFANLTRKNQPPALELQ